jgi:hypothetical protein
MGAQISRHGKVRVQDRGATCALDRCQRRRLRSDDGDERLSNAVAPWW